MKILTLSCLTESQTLALVKEKKPAKSDCDERCVSLPTSKEVVAKGYYHVA